VLPVVSVALCYVWCMQFGVYPLVYALLYSTRVPCGSTRRHLEVADGD